MARKPRIEFEGAFYHVILRGNQRQKIFRDDRDRLCYLKRLEHYRERYRFIVYAYVLMSNHVHLLVETSTTPLSKILQGIQFTYTQYFNRRYRTVGHLFQGRYQAILCDRDAYLLELVRYIHLNPVRLKSPEELATYRWSSHHVYLGRRGPVAVDTPLVLEQLANRATEAVRAYRRFIADGHKLGHDDSYYQTIDQRFLGDEEFIERVLHRAPHAEIRPAGRKLGFEKLLQAVAEVYGTTAKDLIASGRQRALTGARAQLAYLSRTWCSMKATDIARRLKRDASMVSRLCATYESDRDLRIEKNIAEVIRKQLTTQA